MKILKILNILVTVKGIHHDQEPKSSQFPPAYFYVPQLPGNCWGSLWHSFSVNTMSYITYIIFSLSCSGYIVQSPKPPKELLM